MSKLNFPHKYRIFPALRSVALFRGSVFLLTLFTFIITLLSINQPQDQLSQAKNLVLINPTAATSYLRLADEYYTRSMFEKAIKTARKAQVLANQTNNIQARRQTTVFLEKMDLDTKRLTRDLQFWQLVSSRFPNYRDAYLQLALLSYHRKDYSQAKDYLEKVLELDPNNQIRLSFYPLVLNLVSPHRQGTPR